MKEGLKNIPQRRPQIQGGGQGPLDKIQKETYFFCPIAPLRKIIKAQKQGI